METNQQLIDRVNLHLDELIAKDRVHEDDAEEANNAVQGLESIRRLFEGTDIERKITEIIVVCGVVAEKVETSL